MRYLCLLRKCVPHKRLTVGDTMNQREGDFFRKTTGKQQKQTLIHSHNKPFDFLRQTSEQTWVISLSKSPWHVCWLWRLHTWVVSGLRKLRVKRAHRMRSRISCSFFLTMSGGMISATTDLKSGMYLTIKLIKQGKEGLDFKKQDERVIVNYHNEFIFGNNLVKN